MQRWVRRLGALAVVGFFGGVTVMAACGSSSDADDRWDDSDGKPNQPNGEAPDEGNFSGDDAAPGCVGLRCQQHTCSNGATTTVSGKVYAPNGKLPLYNAIVYVPNQTPDALTKGATCDRCGAVTGDPVVSALSDATGSFILKDVPVGKNIPLVVQIGKWRRQVSIPAVKACSDTAVDAELTRLPKNQSEGDMPRIALTLGACDAVGCMLPKLGIDPSEFGVEGDGPSKSVHTFATEKGFLGFGPLVGPPGATSASDLWNDANKLKNYDMAILSCECSEKGNNKGDAAYAAMTEYLEAGGRIFTTDFMYTWYKYSPDPGLSSMSVIPGGAPGAGSPVSIDTSFPKGQALAAWLDNAVGIKNGDVTPDVVYGNFSSTDPGKAQVWGTSKDMMGGGGSSSEGPRVVTVNAPVGVPAEEQCGRAVHLDLHANNQDAAGADYPKSCSKNLLPAESMLAFFLFDLSSCIQEDKSEPKPPPVN